MRRNEAVCPSAEERMKRDEREVVLYNEIKESVCTIKTILKFFKKGDLDKQTAESNCLLAYEELRTSLERHKEEWGASELKEVWNSFKVWRTVPLLNDAHSVKMDVRKMEMFEVERRMESLEKYIHNHKSLEEFGETEKSLHIIEKIKHFFAHLPVFK